VAHVYERAEAASKVPTQAQLQANEARAVETQIQQLMRRPGYLDQKHRDHVSLVEQVASLHRKLNP
jgi:hypothetical protein